MTGAETGKIVGYRQLGRQQQSNEWSQIWLVAISTMKREEIYLPLWLMMTRGLDKEEYLMIILG